MISQLMMTRILSPLIRFPHHELSSLRELNPLSWFIKENPLPSLSLHIVQHRLQYKVKSEALMSDLPTE